MRTRLGFLCIIAGAAIPLALVSVAFACGRLATLHLRPSPVKQGAEVTGFGRNYTAAPTASEVTLRLDSRTGRVLWSGRPAPNGEIVPTFAAPNVKSGEHTILALQTTGTGAPSSGTPGRASIFIGSRAQSRAASSSSTVWPAAGPQGGGGSGGGLASVGADAGLLAAGLLGSGVALLRRGRQRWRPAGIA